MSPEYRLHDAQRDLETCRAAASELATIVDELRTERDKLRRLVNVERERATIAQRETYAQIKRADGYRRERDTLRDRLNRVYRELHS